jgi:hypothetical protein
MLDIGIDKPPPQIETLEERIAKHDAFRTSLKGGRVELLPAVQRLDPRMIGRLICAVAIYNRFHPESDHSDGMIIFAGFVVRWEIHEEHSGLVMLVGLEEYV